ncbi:MAG: hypothetical protein RLZZ369_339, partial [Pseudomonadota bacterium]
LSAWGMRVTLAEDGQDALDLLMAHPKQDADFDLALVDMNMPRLDGQGLAEAIKTSGRYAGLKMVLLSSVSSPDDVRRAQEVGFQRFVPKPLRKGELRQAILGISAELGDAPNEAIRLNKQVLVVEDNAVNQEVCSQMLRRLGCEVKVASSALEGLRRLGEHRYDLVLMDIQMPGMDGIEALNWFRKGSNNRFTFVTPSDTPVIAVTANALEGDEQRFLDQGFDDYLSKPFRQSQLLKVLLEHAGPIAQNDEPAAAKVTAVVAALEVKEATAPAAAVEAPQPVATNATSQNEVSVAAIFDTEALRRLRELDPKGDNKLIERVAKAFETSVGRLQPQLEESIQAQDKAGILHVVHTLKSSSASIGALKLSQQCAEVETMIRRQSGEDLSPRLRDIPPEITRVLAGLRLLLESKA